MHNKGTRGNRYQYYMNFIFLNTITDYKKYNIL